MEFAEILRSSDRLRNTFDRVSGWSFWWRLVLALHGKPVADGLSEDRRIAVLAAGFRFYGRLYLGLGVVLLLGAGAWLLMAPSLPKYWAAVSGIGALYLIACSRLAFQGAAEFSAGSERGATLLVTFFVSIIVFLAALGALLSSWLHGAADAYDLPNVALLAAFILFGIGSYLIELLYLVWWRTRENQ